MYVNSFRSALYRSVMLADGKASNVEKKKFKEIIKALNMDEHDQKEADEFINENFPNGKNL